jgi:hypothetical protein
MKRALPIILAVAALSIGAPTVSSLAQDAAAGGAQANDPEAQATAAYTAWKGEADPAKKYDMGKQIVTQYPGTKAAEAVAYAYIFDQKTDQTTVTHKYEVSKAYYDTGVTKGQDGAYAEYALANLALLEKDPSKLMEYGRTYLQKYPSGKFNEYVKTAMAAARYQTFSTAIKEKRYPDAIKLADEAFAANENEFAYAYYLSVTGLTDETTNGANSQLVGKVSAWADRGIQFIESGKSPAGSKPDAWATDKAKALPLLYKAKGVDTYMRIVGTKPTTAEAMQPAIDALKAAAAKNEKDAALEYFLALAYTQQYSVYSNQYTAMTPTDQAADAGKALLVKVNAAADMVIDSYIKAIAYAGETSALATQVQKSLEDLWNFRHPDAPNGWKDEIKKVNGGAPAGTPGK